MQIYNDFPLDKILWYKIGGKAKTFIQASNSEDLKEALEFIVNNEFSRIFICGLGSNLIFSDANFDGVVLQIVSTGKPEVELLPDGRVKAFGGVVFDHVIQAALQNNLVGIGWAGGLPGTIGAGVRGNVGAFGGEIKDIVDEVEVIELEGSKLSVYSQKKEDLSFSYRHSLIKEKKNLFVSNVTLKLQKGTDKELESEREAYITNIAYRKNHHPLEYPNCGSVFKNIKGEENVGKVLSVWPDIKESVETKWHGKVAMGYVIKRLGLSGKRVGNAQISEKHSNFIVNLGGAKAKDVFTIIHEIQEKAQETFGFTPEVEVEIVE